MKPTISVILAVYNERPHVEEAVASVLSQQTKDFELELLCVDGASTDGTTETLARLASEDSRVRHVLNPFRKTPYAFNIGLQEAKGDYVAILGSHTEYAGDYLQACLRDLREYDATGCSGALELTPASESFEALLVGWLNNDGFGMPGSRNLPEGFVDTIPYGVFRRQALVDMGGYDLRLHRNQDNDMNHRLHATGHRLYLTKKTWAKYRCQPTVRAQLRYALKGGYWNAISLKISRQSMRVRHIIPAVFTGSVLFGWLLALTGARRGMLGVLRRLAGLALPAHLVTGTVSALKRIRSSGDLRMLALVPLYTAFHFTYGLGLLKGLLRGEVPAPDPDYHGLHPGSTTETTSRANAQLREAVKSP